MTDIANNIPPSDGDLRVWHIPNVPSEGFHISVANLAEAKIVLTALAEYDLYLGEGVIATNAQGLEVFESIEWVEWEDDDGYSLIEVMDRE